MKKYHQVSHVAIDERELHIRVDGVGRTFPLSAVSDKLCGASQAQRENLEISPSGYGIHWPTLDEDISIDGLLKLRNAPWRARPGSRQATSVSR